MRPFRLFGGNDSSGRCKPVPPSTHPAGCAIALPPRDALALTVFACEIIGHGTAEMQLPDRGITEPSA